jgi:hypothetical protein
LAWFIRQMAASPFYRCGFPGIAAQEIGIVEYGVVISPVNGVLHRADTGDRSFEARGLGDEPVGHVPAVAVAADAEVRPRCSALLVRELAVGSVREVAIPRNPGQFGIDAHFFCAT